MVSCGGLRVWLVVLVVIVCLGGLTGRPQDLNSKWRCFKERYNKAYRSHRVERIRRQAWEENLAKIRQHNDEVKLGLHRYELRPNPLADMTLKQYVRSRIRMIRSRWRPEAFKFDHEILLGTRGVVEKLPDKLNWRDQGFVLPPQRQLDCGSCYAFSVASCIEAQLFKKTGNLTNLSKQQLVDCSIVTGNYGCDGGSFRKSLMYIQKYGLMEAKQYEYTAKKSMCKYQPGRVVANISSWVALPPHDEQALQVAVSTVGPIAVAVDASQHTFQLYASGIYEDKRCSSKALNHGMLLIGFTKDAWVLQNWWGSSWGENGTMRIARHRNMCGVATHAAYAVL